MKNNLLITKKTPKYIFLILAWILFVFPIITKSQTSPHAYFDASTHSYIDFGKASSLTSYSALSSGNKLTVTMWVKWQSKSKLGVGQWANLFSMADSSASQNQGVFWVQHNSDNSKFEISLHTNTKSTIQSNTTPVDGQWYHVAMVYDGSLGSDNLKLYVNGVEESAVSKTGNICAFPSKAKLNMGRWLNSNNNGGFNGSIDEVSVWNSALSVAQISSIKANPESITGVLYNASGLIAYYNFKDKKAEDLTSNTADGVPARNVVFWDTDSKNPFVYLTASEIRFCSGASIDFIANARNNENQSYYNFFVNGVSKQNSETNTCSSSSLFNGDKIHIQLFSVPKNRGTIDSTFKVGTGFNNNVFTVAPQSDGKIFVGGEFTAYKSNTVNYIVRLNSDGSVDNSFNTGTSFNGIVQAIKIQSDGKIIVVGNFTSYNGTSTNGVIRLNSDGTIDSGFNYGTGFNNIPFAIAIQGDGKIIIGGQFTTYKGVTSNRLIRLNTDGSIDATFSIGTGFNNIVYAIEIQPDGKIVTGGTYTLYNAVASNRITRLNSNGTMDAMFLVGTGMDKIVYAIAIQNDGKILAGGTFTKVNDIPNNRIIRLNTNGTIDNSFILGAGFNGTVRSINTRLDNYILIGGQFTSYNGKTQNRITRLYSSGSTDTLFFSGSGFDNNVYACSYSSDEKIIAGGIFTTYNGKSHPSIVKIINASDSKNIINSDTITVDVRLNSTNVSVSPISSQFCEGTSVILNAFGAETYVWSNGLGTNSSVNYTPTNSTTITVTGYSSDGCFSSATTNIIVDKKPEVGIWPANPTVCSQQSIAIFALGAQSYQWCHGLGSGSSKTVNPINTTIYTITATGSNACTSTKQVTVVADKVDISLKSSDTSICIEQPVTFTLLSNEAGIGSIYNFFLNDVSVQNSISNTYFSNTFVDEDEIHCEVLINPIANGSADTSFNIGTGFGSVVRALAYQSDGKLIVGGEFNSYKSTTANYIVRLNSDGSIDNSFITGTGFNDFVYAIKIQIDGKIIVAGNFTQYKGVNVNRIVRLNVDGSVDTGFQTGTGFNNNAYAIAIQGDGKILVGGQFTTYNGVSHNRIIRLNTNGTVDADYLIDSGFDNVVYAIEVQYDGKAIIGGSFTSYSSVLVNRLVRLNTNGTIDAMFISGYGFNKEVYAISVQNDSKIIIGGTFTLVDNVAINRIVRLNSNGTTDNTFNVGSGLNGTVRSMIILSDDNVIVVGQFTSYNGSSANRIVKIQKNGTKEPAFVSGVPNDNIYALSNTSSKNIFIGGAFTNYDSKSTNSLALIKNTCCFNNIYTSSSIIIQVSSIQTNTVLNVLDSTICIGNSIVLVASGSLSYEWSDGYGVGSTITISPTASDTISVTGHTVDGCIGFAEAIINVVNHPELTIMPENPKICEGNSVILRAKGADSYMWSDGIGSGSEKTVNPTTTKTYTITGSISGCTSVKEITVDVFKTSLSIETSSNQICSGDNVTYTATSPNPGFSNTYNFTINGVSVQNTSSNVFSTTTVNNNDEVKCQSNSVFINSGIIDINFVIGNGFNGAVRQMIQQPDGKYIIIGQFTSYQGAIYNRIIRLNPDGTVDNSFSIGSGFNGLIRNISLQPDGKILVVGDFSQFNGNVVNRIVRLNADGSKDNTFITGTGFNSRAYIIKPLTSGKILVSGAFTSYDGMLRNRLIRLNSDGSVDAEFNIGTGFPNGNVNELFVQNDDKIIAAGSFIGFNGNSSINRIVRLLPNGDIDNAFALGSGFDDAPVKIMQQNDLKILIVGAFTTYNGNLRSRIIRLNLDGTIDESFDSGLGFNDIVYDIVNQPDNKLVVTGAFISFNGVNLNRLARLNNDGSIDNSLTIGDGFNADGRALCLNSDGNILVGGVFTNYNTKSSNNLVLLKNAFCYESSLTSNTIVSIVKPKPNITIATSQNPICLFGSTIITASSLDNIGSWAWSSGQNTAQITVSPSENTAYTVSATSTNGCENHNQITINLLTSPVFWINPPSFNICEGNSVTLSAYGATSYEWSDGLGSGIQKTVNPTSTKTYTVTATNASACTGTKDVTVSVTKFDVSLVSSDTTFCHGKPVTFTATSPQFNASSEYDFLVNGVSLQKSTSNTYASSTLNNSDVVKCLFTPNVVGNGVPLSEFNIGSGLNGNARVIVRQNDGKFIVGGTFTNYNGSAAINIVRVNSDGFIDNTFSSGTGFDNEVRIIKVQPDGKIIVGGVFTLFNGASVNRIVRLNEDGSIDNTFIIGAGFNNNVNSIVIQNDGKIIIGGEYTTYKGTTYNRIVRLNQDGSIDASFSIGTAFNNIVYALELQNDGKILVGGNFTLFSGTSINRIARLNTNGSIDAAFNVGGGANGVVSAISCQSDGKVIIGGSFTSYNGNSVNRIVRVSSTGAFDATYSIGSGFNNNVLCISRMSNDDLIVAGQFTTYKGIVANQIIRLQSNGDRDTQFGGNGANSVVYSVALGNDWKIYAVGAFFTYNAISKNRIVAIQNSNCYQQSTQSTPITLIVNANTTNIQINASSAVICNGNTVNLTASGADSYTWSHSLGSGATKSVTPNATTTYTVMGINADGCFSTKDVTTTVIPIPETLINTFSPIVCDGTNVTLYASGADSYEWSDGLGSGVEKTVNPSVNTTYSVTGNNNGMCFSSSQITLANHKTTVSITSNALNVCGNQNITFTAVGTNAGIASTYKFMVNGLVVQNTTSNTYTTNILTTNDTVQCELISVPDNMAVVDAGINFGTGFNGTVYQIVRQNDGKYIVAGDFTTYKGVAINRIIRLNADGSFDNTFTVGTGFNLAVRSMIIQSNNKVIVGGQFTTYNGTNVNRIVRLKTDGSIDNSFAIGTAFNEIVYSIAMQMDGKILVGGNFTNYNGNVRNRIIRLNIDGSIDNSFTIGAGFNNYISKLIIQPDGKITAIGAFTSYKGVAINRIIRLNSDGSQDATFAIGTGFNSVVNAIAAQSDGKYLVGGSFTSYNGSTRNRIIRINDNGSIDAGYTVGTGFETNVLDIVIQPDNKAIISGQFTTYTGLSRNRIVRLFDTGLMDNNFNIGTGFNGNTRSAILQPDGNVLIVGEFTTYKGSSINRIIRLKNTLCYEGGILSNKITSVVKSYPVLTLTATPSFVCIAQEVSINASSNIPIESWIWNTGNTTAQFLTTPLVTQTYTVTATSSQGCTSTGQVQVDVNTSSIPVAQISISNNPICEGSATNLTASGGDSYLWSNDLGTTASVTVAPNVSTTYTVTVTNASGCTGVANHELTVNSKPILSISGLNFICQGQTTTITASGGDSYEWSNAETTASITVSPLVNTTYTVTASNSNGCTSTSSYLVNVVSNISINISPKDAYVCPSESMLLTATGADSYTWSNGLGTGSSKTVQPTNTTTYIVTGSDASGCSSVAEVTVYVFTGPKIELEANNNNVCVGVPVVFTATPKYIKNTPNIKFYVNGSMVQSSLSDSYLAMSLSNGDVVHCEMDGIVQSQGVADESFNSVMDGRSSIINGVVRTFARQSDNSIIIGGAFSQINRKSYPRLARINSDGSLDTTFHIGYGLNNTVFTVAVQADQKILVGGQFTSVNGVVKNRIIRINNDGTTDNTFNIGKGFNNIVYSIVVQSDGKILVAGNFTTYNDAPCNRIVRLNPDGSVDSGFNTGGGFNNIAFSITLQSDGKILVGGSFVTYNNISFNRMVRLNSNGSIDSGFNIGTGFNNIVYSIGVQSDGNIVIGGGFTAFNGINRSRIVRLTSDGLLDNTFVIGNGFNNIVYSLAIQSDGKILTGGQFTSFNGVASNYVARLLSNGTMDGNLSVGSGFSSTVFEIEPIENSKFIAVGQFVSYNSSAKTYLAQIEENGLVNYDFNGDYGFNNSVQAIASTSNGKIYVGGSFSAYNDVVANRIAMLNEDGQQNIQFNSGTGFNNTVNAIATQSDGKVIVTGAFTTYNGTSCNRIVRLNSDGSIDNTFVVANGFNNIINDVVIQGDGKIIVGGNFSTYKGVTCIRIARLNTDGSLDVSFISGTGFSSRVRKISIQNDGKIIIGGDFAVYNGVASARVVRLLPNGLKDPSFVVGTGFSGNVYTVTAQNDGKIIVGGIFTSHIGVASSRIARLNSDGSLDNSFVVASGFNNIVNSILVLKDNKYLIGGSFTAYKGAVANRIVKLNSDGSIDSQFEVNTAFNNVTNVITQLPDGMIAVGGLFTSYNGVNAKRITKISNSVCDITSASSNPITMIVGQPGCESKSLQPIISNSKVEYCENELSDSFILNNYGNSNVTWQKRYPGNQWVNVGLNSSIYFDPSLELGYWEYRAVLNKNSQIEKVSNSIIIKVNSIPKPDFTYNITGNTLKLNCNEVADLTYWSFGDGIASNSKQPKHVYEKEGQYVVILELSNGDCISSISQNIEIKKSTFAQNEFKFTVYPNPSLYGLFNLLYSSDESIEKANILVFDSYGKIIYSEIVSEVINGSILNIDLSKNSGGVYLMKITHSKGVFNIKLVIR